jgi:hypothetical protein
VQGGALTDDLVEVVLGAYLFLQVGLLLVHVRHDQRLLALPHQPRRRFCDGKLRPGLRRGFGGLQDVQPHGVARRLVQDQAEVIEVHHLVKPAGQLVEQRGEVAVRDDRFRDSQQGSVRAETVSRLSV